MSCILVINEFDSAKELDKYFFVSVRCTFTHNHTLTIPLYDKLNCLNCMKDRVWLDLRNYASLIPGINVFSHKYQSPNKGTFHV